jgi:hypothetical protein
MFELKINWVPYPCLRVSCEDKGGAFDFGVFKVQLRRSRRRSGDFPRESEKR